MNSSGHQLHGELNDPALSSFNPVSSAQALPQHSFQAVNSGQEKPIQYDMANGLKKAGSRNVYSNFYQKPIEQLERAHLPASQELLYHPLLQELA